VLEGSGWGGLVGEQPVRLEAGDVLVFPHGDAHMLASEPGLQGGEDLEFYATLRTANLPLALRVGDGADCSARLACGFLGCDLRPFNPLVAALPRMLHDRAADPGEREYLRLFVERAVAESRQGAAGSQCVLTRLSELVFVEVVRRYLRALGPEQPGWLGALRDPVVGRALARLHQRPAHAWSLDELAAAAATSRTVLAERFRVATGLPPMQYLAHWRMQLACRLLDESGASIGEVARDVGYESESAFQRTFKKIVGVAPGAWRRRGRQGQAATTTLPAQRPAT
jgi:AraC-like DNA-binding protein